MTPASVKGAALAAMLTAAAAVYADVQQRNENPQSTVLIFLSVDCPVSNRYAPEIQRLYRTFASRGLRFELVYPNPADTPDAIRRHVTDYDLPGVTVRDVDGTSPDLLGRPSLLKPLCSIRMARSHTAGESTIDLSPSGGNVQPPPCTICVTPSTPF